MGRTPAALVLLGVTAPALAGQPLRYAEDRAPAIVNPLFTTTMSEARLGELVFDGLFSDDRELRSVPNLVHTFELAEDKRSLDLTLRQDVSWHDGEALTSDDVLFTLAAMANPATASTEAGRVSWITKAERLDDHRLRLKFAREEHAPEDKLHFKILPEHRFSGTTIGRTDPFRTAPVGTGPFRLVRFDDDNSIQLERYEDYHLPVRQEAFTLREVSDKNYQSKLLVYQSVEALMRVLPRDLATLQADRQVVLYPYQTNSWWYVGFNHRDASLGDARVREAVHLMLDVPELLAPIGTGDLLTGPFVKSSPYYNHDVPRVEADPDRAAALLTEAGLTHNGRQWTRGGEPVTLRLAWPSALETAQDVVLAIQGQLRAQGLTVEPVPLSAVEWKEKVWRDHDFDLILSQWTFDRSEDIYEQFHSEGSRNFVGYDSPRVDTLLDRARLTTDPLEKKATLREVHAVVAEETPVVFLWTLDSYAAMSRRVNGVEVHPFYFFTWARDWYVD